MLNATESMASCDPYYDVLPLEPRTSIERQRKPQRGDKRLYTKLEDREILSRSNGNPDTWLKRGTHDDTRRSERPIISLSLPRGTIENMSENFVSSKFGTKEQRATAWEHC